MHILWSRRQQVSETCLCERSVNMILKNTGISVYYTSRQLRARLRIASEYTVPETMRALPPPLPGQQAAAKGAAPLLMLTSGSAAESSSSGADLGLGEAKPSGPPQAGQLVPYNSAETLKQSSALVARRPPPKVPEPNWHAPWELSAVVSGHLGWVRCIAFDPSNEWFVTGSADRTIKIWDLAKCCAGAEGGLKLTLTGHISAVRGLAVSSRSPYLFSCGEDKQIKCNFSWPLESTPYRTNYRILLMSLRIRLGFGIQQGYSPLPRASLRCYVHGPAPHAGPLDHWRPRLGREGKTILVCDIPCPTTFYGAFLFASV
jgi:WD40 repeat protein